MKRRLKLHLAWPVLFAGFAVGAEETPPPPPKSSEARTVKDPTQLSPRMRELLTPKNAPQAQAVHTAPPPKLPQVILRGLVAGAKDGDGSAAIEVKGGGVYLVRAGSTVQAATDNNQIVMLQVKSIGKDSIVIEVPELQQTLTIR